MPPSVPGLVVLNANLVSIAAGTEVGGYLRVTLCGFGPQIPGIPGTGNLADAGVPQYVGPQNGSTPVSIGLYVNTAIQPAGTFYEIAVLDQDKNVIQANNYILNATTSNPVDLSNLLPIVPPYGFPAGNLAYQPCTAAGATYVSPGIVIAATYNGIILPLGLAAPTLSYTLDTTGKIITPNFTPDALDRFDAICIL